MGLNLIPTPVRVRGGSQVLPLGAVSDIQVSDDDAGAAAGFLVERASIELGIFLKIRHGSDPAVDTVSSSIIFKRNAAVSGSEAYRLTITDQGIVIEATESAGWFYGVQTLMQLAALVGAALGGAASGGSGEALSTSVELPCVVIDDSPRFPWRGLMLDVSRHLMPVDGILRLLDCMAMHKLNLFHWHLTDDQGWRVESKKYPRLTEIGAFRRGGDGVLTPGNQPEVPPQPGTYGGFYTHDDIRKVVAHAAALHIRVVPEIEMPGHAMAALAAYPELSCTGATFEPAVRTGVFHDVYCAGNEATFELLQNVIDELLPLFPSEYIHVGGDECPKDRWKLCPKCQARIRSENLKDEHELQSYFIRRMSRFLAGRGKKLIGWDEILEGGLAPGATVMSWRGVSGGISAAQAGRDVVMSPKTHCYLDYRQASTGEPVAIGNAVLPLQTVFEFEPIPPELTKEQAVHILGMQGNVWTEYMSDMRHVEYMIWPRAAAIAEIGWSPAGGRDFVDFARRCKANEPRLKKMGNGYRPI